MKTQKVRKQENTGYRKRSKEEEEEMFNVESVETGKYRLQEEK